MMKKRLANLRLALWRVITFPFWLVSLPFRPLVAVGRKIHWFMTFEPEDRPLWDVATSLADSPRVVLGEIFAHIAAFRVHFLRATAVTVVCVGFAAYFTPQAADYLAAPVGGIANLQAIEVIEGFNVYLRIAIMLGIALAMPYIAFEVWFFFALGLRARTRQFSLLAIPLAVLFFAGGLATAFYLIVPPALPILLGWMDFQVALRPDSYFSFLTTLMFWMGVVFEFPLVVFILSALGIVNPKMLTSQWRLSVVVIAILAMIITPTSDVVNMLIVMTPMLVLYIASIGLSALGGLVRRRMTHSEEKSS
jgi:sec-independent protein translocase protein TatC